MFHNSEYNLLLCLQILSMAWRKTEIRKRIPLAKHSSVSAYSCFLFHSFFLSALLCVHYFITFSFFSNFLSPSFLPFHHSIILTLLPPLIYPTPLFFQVFQSSLLKSDLSLCLWRQMQCGCQGFQLGRKPKLQLHECRFGPEARPLLFVFVAVSQHFVNLPLDRFISNRILSYV